MGMMKPRMLAILLSVWLTTTAMGAPALTEGQQARLEDVTDRSLAWEEAGLYALLENVAGWERGDERGARVPDYEQLLADPAAARGETFLIEGRFAGHSEELGFAPQVPLSRPGPWGEALTQWGVVIDDQTKQAVVVYLVDPENQLPQPRRGQQVRVPARFYKVLRGQALDDQPMDFLTFVGRGPTVVEQAQAGQEDEGMGSAVLAVLLLAAAGALGLLIWRLNRGQGLSLNPRPLPTQQRRREEAEAVRLLNQQPGEDRLPQDPADALDALASRHATHDEQSTHGQG